MVDTFVSDFCLKRPGMDVAGALVELDGERYYRISNLEAMPPFFMTLVSDSDHWFFISSNGALTAGRKDPDHALFPYHADDRIHDSQEHTGSKTILRVMRGESIFLWEPFSQRYEGLYRTTRNLYKSVHGNKIVFEEINEDLALTFRCTWMNSDTFGFVRRSELVNGGPDRAVVAVVDGLQNILPAGLGWRFQLEYSTLGDGYKRTELLPETGLALFRLSSLPVDKAEPSEALRVNVAWSTGLGSPLHLLSTTQLGAFRRGEGLEEETDIRGRRGAYLLHATLRLEPQASRDWFIVADVSQDAVRVSTLKKRLEATQDVRAELLEDVARGTRNLIRLVANADGLQVTEDELSTSRHFSNTLFNIMRGGIPGDGYHLPKADFQAFLAKSNVDVAASYDAFLEGLPDTLSHQDWLNRLTGCDDPDLERLAHEYLPLTFSRRHGDPSRPWNAFSILVKHQDGTKIFNYQGNWRDIFQNWEALGFSYPSFLESMIFKFVDSTTADGYNPYRVLREGFEWEIIDAHDPWSFIGYWGDHQVIYLLKLLEASERYHPGTLEALLGRRVFTYANVPYRLKPYQEMLANPRSTIAFDQEAHEQTMALAGKIGADGKLLMDLHGIFRGNLTEKLLVVALSKLSNFIPEAGIWMNTQRPEWNDANNALVGHGVSVVTLCYLRRYLAFCQDLFKAPGAVEISVEIADMLASVASTFEKHAPLLDGYLSDRDRKAVLDALGEAGTVYREKIYGKGFSGDLASMPFERLQAFCEVALRHIDHAIRANRRADGLYHAYNLMKVVGDGIEIRHLYKMLEGQVAVLSSGTLTGEESVEVLDALRASNLYRGDLGSYMLYPDRALPHFLEKNILPDDAASRSELLRVLLKAGNRRIVTRDAEGRIRFNASFRSSVDLKAELAAMLQTEYRLLVEKDTSVVLDLYEEVFDHQSFTGRSGTFFKYEGLGCVYWHMVSKLLLAVDEVKRAAGSRDTVTLAQLDRHYQEIREGLGVHKSPLDYGAIPTDPYSHTPGFAGVQQPGMTGQVKEDFLTRFSEMGVQVQAGCLAFQPWMVPQREFLRRSTTFRCINVLGHPLDLALEPGTLGFTVCQVPIVAHRGGGPSIQVTRQDGSVQQIDGLTLGEPESRAIFERTCEIERLDVYLGLP
jgi:hypothetical protein